LGNGVHECDGRDKNQEGVVMITKSLKEAWNDKEKRWRIIFGQRNRFAKGELS
jgi:hypothetical protein